jgi:serine/threonine protein kinase
VTQAGHTRAVDWWAAGVLLYEMVAGAPPFGQEDRVAMFRAICAGQYAIPGHFSPELGDLVRRLLARAPGRRLGCGAVGAAEVKAHAWFRGDGFNWDALAARRARAPFVPKVSSPDDASNFEGSDAGAPRRDSRYVSTGVFKDF